MKTKKVNGMGKSVGKKGFGKIKRLSRPSNENYTMHRTPRVCYVAPEGYGMVDSRGTI
jgi:hypothetical protein